MTLKLYVEILVFVLICFFLLIVFFSVALTMFVSQLDILLHKLINYFLEKKMEGIMKLSRYETPSHDFRGTLQ